MAVISLKRSPWDWLFCTRSLPARSTKHREAADRHRNTGQDSHTRTQSDNRIIICSNLTSQPVWLQMYKTQTTRLHLHLTSLPEFSPSMSSWNTECEREEWSFMLVRAVDRFWLASAIRLQTWMDIWSNGHISLYDRGYFIAQGFEPPIQVYQTTALPPCV